MDLTSIYIANGVGIFLLLVMWHTSQRRVLRNRPEDRIFSLMMLGVTLGCLIEGLSYTLDGQVFPGARLLNYAANTFLYTDNMLLSFSVIMYVDFSFDGSLARIRQKYLPQIIVGMIMLAALVVNLFLPIAFQISDLNVYARRPFGYAYLVVFLYFCLTSLVMTRRYEKESGLQAFVSIKLFLLPILIGVSLQFAFYGLSLGWLSAAIGLTGLYMMHLNELAYIDPLVGSYNRQYMNHILSSWIGRERSFAGAMIDVDYFKQINDRFGHAAGDQALQEVTDLLHRIRGDKEWVFRFAGDEFIVLRLTENPEGLTPYLQRLDLALSELNRSADRNPIDPVKDTDPSVDAALESAGLHQPAICFLPLSLSYGTSFFPEGCGEEALEVFMKEMDDRMYEMKARHHREQI